MLTLSHVVQGQLNRNITSSIASAYKSKNVTVFIIDLLIDQFLYVARLRNGN